MAPSPTGRLFLVPNALDLGTPAVETPLDELLPHSVLRTAAALEHWVAENARSARAFLKRVDRIVPLGRPIQAISIVELPRPAKGQPAGGPGSSRGQSHAVAEPAGGHRAGRASPNERAASASVPAGRGDGQRVAEADAMTALLAPASKGHDLGLISEAGLPAVADPGAALVEAAHRLGITVVALPGPSSLLLALAASGLNGQSFAFVGYLPVDAAARAARVRELESLSRRQQQTQLVIETPYRNAALLTALLGALQPETRLAVSCGLTLPGGFSRTDTVRHWRERPTELPSDVPAVYAWLAR